MLEKNDLRIKKTKKLVFDAILSLMLRRRFDQITVNELCEVAQISRATFYVHFEDKYDLLRLWLTSLIMDAYNQTKHISYDKKEKYINEFVYENKKVIEHLLLEADNETLEIVFDVIRSFSNISAEKGNKMNPEYVVLSNIYVGGMISYLKWQAMNKFPQEVSVLNGYLYDTIKKFLL